MTVLFLDSATPFLQFLMLCQQGIGGNLSRKNLLNQNEYLSSENSKEVLSLFCMRIQRESERPGLVENFLLKIGEMKFYGRIMGLAPAWRRPRWRNLSAQ